MATKKHNVLVFYIDVDGIEEHEIKRHMEEIKEKLGKPSYIADQYFFPVRNKGQGTRVESFVFETIEPDVEKPAEKPVLATIPYFLPTFSYLSPEQRTQQVEITCATNNSIPKCKCHGIEYESDLTYDYLKTT